MKRKINNDFELLLDGLYKKNTEKVNLIYNKIVSNNSTESKLVMISTINALLYSNFNNKCCDRSEEIFNENYLNICSGNISPDLFTNYIELVENNVHKKNDYIAMAYKYIEDNIDKPLTLETLASELHISKNYFSNLFKKVTGITFSRYVNYRRIERAKLYLQSSNHSLNDIAQRCGYNSQSHFSTTFLQFENISPGAYRYSSK